MAIDETTEGSTVHVHAGPLTDFYPEKIDRDQFTYRGIVESDSIDPSLSVALNDARASLTKRMEKIGATAAFNMHVSIAYAPPYFRQVFIMADAYSRTLK